VAARRKPKRGPPSLFGLAERQIVGLYDAGVMSPAVLHHLVAAYADSGIDWNEEGALQTVDGHTVQEAVVIVMMPARPLKSARKDFITVVEHLAGAQAPAPAPAQKTTEAAETEDAEDAEEAEKAEEADDADLLNQLGGTSAGSNARAPKKSRAAAKNEPKQAGFNPLVGARAVQSRDRR
jgi:hypothetical protein